jgi:hypothetical protein
MSEHHRRGDDELQHAERERDGDARARDERLAAAEDPDASRRDAARRGTRARDA